MVFCGSEDEPPAVGMPVYQGFVLMFLFFEFIVLGLRHVAGLMIPAAR